jgi:thiol-disulfide isomerase/thioredoxin
MQNINREEYRVRSLQFVLFSLGFLSLASCNQWEQRGHALVGKVAPKIDLETLNGNHFRLANYVGKQVVMVDMWATWCGPCCQELPILAQVAHEYRPKGVVFCAVDLREEKQKVADFIRNQKLDVTVALDHQGTVASAYQANGIPMLVLIDKQGIVQSVHVGFRSDLKAVLHQELDELLAAKELAAGTGADHRP